MDFFGLRRQTTLESEIMEGRKLQFMLLDIDYVIQPHTPATENHDSGSKSAVVGGHEANAVVRLMGVTVNGASVVCMVHNKQPYFYAKPLSEVRPEDLNWIRMSLNAAVGTPESGTPASILEAYPCADPKKQNPSLKRPFSDPETKFRNKIDRDGEDISDFFSGRNRRNGYKRQKTDMEMAEGRGGLDDEMDVDDDFVDSDCEDDDNGCEDPGEADSSGGQWAPHRPKKPIVTTVSLVSKESIYGYTKDGRGQFIQIFTRIPGDVPKVRKRIEEGMFDPVSKTKKCLSVLGNGGSRKIHLGDQVFEANCEFVVRFMADRGVRGMGWVEVDQFDGPFVQPPLPLHGLTKDRRPKDHGETGPARFAPGDSVWANENHDPKNPTPLAVSGGGWGCPKVIHANVANVRGVKLIEAGGSETNAPLRILSYDIECVGREGQFPDPEHDPVCTIAMHLDLRDQRRKVNVVLQLHRAGFEDEDRMPEETCLLCFDREEALLRMFGSIVRLVDPDIVTGYNIDDFDTPYLWLRMKTLGLPDAACFGRIRGERSTRVESTFTSRAHGTKVNTIIAWQGRGIMDMLSLFLRTEKLGSYSLNSVCEKFLQNGEAKDDLHHSLIEPFQCAQPGNRRKIWTYCRKDAILPVKLMEKMMSLFRSQEQARVSTIPFNWLLKRGMGIMIFSLLEHDVREMGFLLPTMRRDASKDGNNNYEGATVIDPKKGFYNKKPVATLDFSSLYPSIMIAWNCCYSTLVEGGVAEAKKMGLRGPEKFEDRAENNNFPLPDDDYVITPIGAVFVRKHIREGILPAILVRVLAARDVAKADMKKATDPVQKNTLDGRQLALKLVANSCYGFTGAVVGRLACLQISASVTSIGRHGLELTKTLVMKKYAGSDVIYGDTDSVMIQFDVPDEDVETFQKKWHDPENKAKFLDAMTRYHRTGIEAAEYVTTFFPPPMKLDFEKVYFPYLLINKKRYAALKWEKPDKFKSLDFKGIELARRDNCSIVREAQEQALNILMIEGDQKKAIDHIKGIITDLLSRRVDLSRLIISKKLTKNPYVAIGAPGGYGNVQTHAILARKLKDRNPLEAPAIGDRVPYVILPGIKGSTVSSRPEDPVYVVRNGLLVDVEYYINQQLKEPLLRIFDPVIPDPNELFRGSHTLVANKRLDTFFAAGNKLLGGAVVPLKSCLGCKCPIPREAGDQGLCGYCQPKREGLLAKLKAVRDETQKLREDVWQVCVKCRPSPESCLQHGCATFYKRHSAIEMAATAARDYKRLDLEW